MENFLNMVYRLKCINRWDTSYKVFVENVAEHSYRVAIISHMLTLIHNKLNKNKKINIEEVLLYSLYHDIHESYTAHIISPIKRNHGNIFLKNMKEYYCKRLICTLPNVFIKDFSRILFNNNKGVHRIIDIADTIDSWYYCYFQISLGNMDFKKKYAIVNEKIHNYKKQYNYVKYFCNKFVDFENIEIIY
jgi:Predicted hydrolases of HD superfamily